MTEEILITFLNQENVENMINLKQLNKNIVRIKKMSENIITLEKLADKTLKVKKHFKKKKIFKLIKFQ